MKQRQTLFLGLAALRQVFFFKNGAGHLWLAGKAEKK
jgi:hypothetical protein